MYNMHTYFSLKNLGQKNAHYMWQNMVLLYYEDCEHCRRENKGERASATGCGHLCKGRHSTRSPFSTMTNHHHIIMSIRFPFHFAAHYIRWTHDKTSRIREHFPFSVYNGPRFMSKWIYRRDLSDSHLRNTQVKWTTLTSLYSCLSQIWIFLIPD